MTALNSHLLSTYVVGSRTTSPIGVPTTAWNNFKFSRQMNSRSGDSDQPAQQC